MARLTDLNLIDLLAAFQSTDPTPGGGSAASLSGAIGASLVAMVGGLPTKTSATAEDQQRLAAARAQCVHSSGHLAVLVDRDADAYEAVMLAYRRPKASDEERAARSAAIQDAVRQAIEVPLDVMRTCAEAAEQAVVVGELGN